jgi:hypothetical protein
MGSTLSFVKQEANELRHALIAAREENAELERREALLTAFVVAFDTDFYYAAQAGEPAVNFRLAQTMARDAIDWIPQPEDQPCPTCGSAVVNLDCWRCVGAENPRS